MKGPGDFYAYTVERRYIAEVEEIQNSGSEQHTELLFSKDLHWLLWYGPAQAMMAEQEGTWKAGVSA